MQMPEANVYPKRVPGAILTQMTRATVGVAVKAHVQRVFVTTLVIAFALVAMKMGNAKASKAVS